MIYRILNNQYFRTWVVVSIYVLLFFMYSENDRPEAKARDWGWMINLNQSLMIFTQSLISLSWYFEAPNKPQKFLFLSFSIFSLLRIFHRLYVLFIDGYYVNARPTYIMMILIVIPLLYLERKWGQSK